MHVDMNAFFASVEQAADPRLRGKPVAVSGPNKRTVIVTASYEARKFGVRTGMVSSEAKQVCPNVIIIPGDNRKYTAASTRIVTIVREYAPLLEVFSIDELFADISRCRPFSQPTPFEREGMAREFAAQIKSRIKKELQLTCSIGIAPNKLLAKLASDIQKPDGLVIIAPDDVEQTMEHLPVEELCGIGSRTKERLRALGITTCGELGRAPVSMLRRRFGIIGEKLRLMGRGIDRSPVVPAEEAPPAKSVGHSMTLENDITSPEAVKKCILQLTEMVGQRMRKDGLSGRTVTLIVRYADFFTFSRRHTIGNPVRDSEKIYQTALKILATVRLAKPVRLLGIIVSGLVETPQQDLLFADDAASQRLTEAVDTVNCRYGNFTLTRALLLERSRHKNVISPAWRPDRVHRVDF
jgi:DNA polymerase-4